MTHAQRHTRRVYCWTTRRSRTPTGC
jgi:hypothetical protein